MLIVIGSSKIKDADGNNMSKNYGCQIAYFSKLRVREPVANKGPVLYRYLVPGPTARHPLNFRSVLSGTDGFLGS